MNSIDLLERENEFKKLNKQLEKKTESLMKEIENAMAKKDIFSDFSCNLTLAPKYDQPKKHFCDTSSTTSKDSIETNKKSSHQNIKKQKAVPKNLKSHIEEGTDNIEPKEVVNQKQCICCVEAPNKLNDDGQFLYAFVSVSVKDNILPQSFIKENVNVESVCKCLSTKIKLLQEQIEKLKASINLKTKQCEGHMTQIADLESMKMDLVNTANNMKSETADMKAKYAVMHNKLNEKDRLYKEQRSEADRVTSELQRLRSRNVHLEARAAAQEELIGNLKQQIQTAKLGEKEYRESARAAAAAHQGTIARLEARARALAAAGTRQAALVDNLRRQNALLAADGALRALEKDYDHFLQQDFDV